MNPTLSTMPTETLKILIAFKQDRLLSLKRDGWLKAGVINPSQKYATLEAQRRRSEIKNMVEELNSRNEN